MPRVGVAPHKESRDALGDGARCGLCSGPADVVTAIGPAGIEPGDVVWQQPGGPAHESEDAGDVRTPRAFLAPGPG